MRRDRTGHPEFHELADNILAVRLDVGRHDPLMRRLDESHMMLSPAGLRICPIVTRYAWPSELDLMARIAGLRIKDRWGGWEREPFTASSRNHVSVYGP